MFKKICIISILLSQIVFSNSQPTIEKNSLYIRDGIFMPKGSNFPFTGMAMNGRDREFYKDGKPDGKWLSFYEDGTLKTIENWEGGILNGKHILYSNEEIKLSESFYQNGEESGKYLLFHDNGAPYIIGEFTDGEATGIWYYYNDAGKLTGTNDFRGNIQVK